MTFNSGLALLFLTCLFPFGLSTSTPVQVDLVFPRNGSTYQPVYPFPIVFALHNFSKAWKYKPTVHWRVNETIPSKGGDPLYQWSYAGWNDYEEQAKWAPPADNVLSINNTILAGRADDANYVIDIDFYMNTGECTQPKLNINRRIVFKTSRTGIMPDLKAADTCATVLGAISVDGREKDNECLQMTPEQAPPVACAYNIDSKAVDDISKAMAVASECPNAVWPNTTGIGTQCDKNAKIKTEDPNAKTKSDGVDLQSNYFTVGIWILTIVTLSIFG
jgi:hypothetical protein